MDFSYLFDNASFSDILIRQNKDGKSWNAHKIILAHHSDMLKKRFLLDTTDKDEKEIEVIWSSDAINLVLRFMYNKDFLSMVMNKYSELNIQDGCKLLIELYKISDYWIIPELSEQICHFIENILNYDNINIFLQVESLYPKIRNSLTKYVCGKFTYMSDEHIVNISEDLMKVIVTSIYRKSEYDYYLKLKRWCKLIGMNKEEKIKFLGTHVNLDAFERTQLLCINAKDYMKVKDSIPSISKSKTCNHVKLCGKIDKNGNSCLNVVDKNEYHCRNCSPIKINVF